MTHRDDAVRWLEDVFQPPKGMGAEDITLEALAKTFAIIRDRLLELGADNATIETWAAAYVNIADRDWPNHRLGPRLRAAIGVGFRVTLHRDEAGKWHASSCRPA